MRKHEYMNPGERPMPDLAPNWVGFLCIHCNHVSGLDDWQIVQMPWDTARCANGRRIRWWEMLAYFFTGSINCLKGVN